LTRIAHNSFQYTAAATERDSPLAPVRNAPVVAARRKLACAMGESRWPKFHYPALCSVAALVLFGYSFAAIDGWTKVSAPRRSPLLITADLDQWRISPKRRYLISYRGIYPAARSTARGQAAHARREAFADLPLSRARGGMRESGRRATRFAPLLVPRRPLPGTWMSGWPEVDPAPHQSLGTSCLLRISLSLVRFSGDGPQEGTRV